MSGGLALRAFCQWKIEHQVRECCVKGLILRNMSGVREMQAVCIQVVTSSSVASIRTKFFWQILDLNKPAVFCSGQCLSMHKMTTYAVHLGGMASSPTFFVYLLDVQFPTDKKLSTTQARQTLQNTFGKQYCQYWLLHLIVIDLIAHKHSFFVEALYVS